MSTDGHMGCIHSDMVDFFLQATFSVKLTADNIAQMDALDSQFHFYCLQLLMPALAVLFKHVGIFRVGKILISSGAIQTHCKDIFKHLVAMATGTGPVYVGR